MISRLFFLILFCFQFHIYSQEDAWIYLIDKENVTESISNPISIITQEAIDRKNLRGIVIDYRDVPVNETYINQLKNSDGITVLAKSKWFNAVHVYGLEADINNLLSDSYVDHIEFFNRNLNVRIAVKESEKFVLKNKRTSFVYGTASTQVEMIHVDNLHELGYTGEGVIIAALDAGFGNVDTMSGFQRLRDSGHILGVYDFYNRSNDVYADEAGYHGTISLSTMAGYFEDEYAGTAPDASFYLFRTDNAFGIDKPIEESLWVEAAERADSLGADIISSSLGFKAWFEDRYNYTSDDMDGITAFITRGANMAFEKGMLVVNSAGNEGADGVIAPADAMNVLSVGAVYGSGEYAYFSSQGNMYQPSQKPDVVARGWNVAVIHESDEVRVAHGTSYSSPIVAGAIACLWQALPNLTNLEVLQLVRESASQYNSPDNFLGYGIPDFSWALSHNLNTEETESLKNQIRIYPNPANYEVHISLPSNEKQVHGIFYNILGKKVLEITLDISSTLDVSSLSNGVYLLKIGTQNGTIIKKLIKN